MTATPDPSDAVDAVDEESLPPLDIQDLDADRDTGVEAVAPATGADLDAAVEAVLFVVDAPISLAALAVAVGAPVPDVRASVRRVQRGYDERGAGVELREVAGGVRIYTRPAQAAAVSRYLTDGQRQRLTQAALETLAVIAYRQPVTRARVSAIRGVNVDGVIRTLLTRGLIAEVGTEPETGGSLFRTTELFLEKLGMRSLDELPSLAPLLPELDSLESADA